MRSNCRFCDEFLNDCASLLEIQLTTTKTQDERKAICSKLNTGWYMQGTLKQISQYFLLYFFSPHFLLKISTINNYHQDIKQLLNLLVFFSIIILIFFSFKRFLIKLVRYFWVFPVRHRSEKQLNVFVYIDAVKISNVSVQPNKFNWNKWIRKRIVLAHFWFVVWHQKVNLFTAKLEPIRLNMFIKMHDFCYRFGSQLRQTIIYDASNKL